jgi:hypothetical protein
LKQKKKVQSDNHCGRKEKVNKTFLLEFLSKFINSWLEPNRNGKKISDRKISLASAGHIVFDLLQFYNQRYLRAFPRLKKNL